MVVPKVISIIVIEAINVIKVYQLRVKYRELVGFHCDRNLMLLEPNGFVFFLVTDQFEAKLIQSLFIVVFDMVQFLEADDSRIAVGYLLHDTGRSKLEIEHRFRCV